ncbi:MAG TPA: hypothetical protein GX699_07625 [Firmicutes bacterium]|nr:hypothetical protein [Bacillota bacterium]
MSEEIYPGDRPTEAELIFHSTTSKKLLSGVRGRVSRTGRTGPVRTPVDFLRGKAKKEYMGNSEVKVYNMYEDQVLPYEEFKELPIEKQVVLMTKWREEIGTNNIIRDMKVSRKKFYSEILKNLGIETKPRGRRPKRAAVEAATAAVPAGSMAEDRGKTETAIELVPAENVTLPAVRTEEAVTFSLAISGLFDGHSAANRMARLARVLDPGAKYVLKVEVREDNS